MTSVATVRLRAGKERSLRRRHPWVFSGAVERVEADPANGSTVRVVAADGAFLGWGAFSSESQIRVRMWSFDESHRVDGALIADRIVGAAARRSHLHHETNAMRLVFAESDLLPGVIIDRYDSVAVLELTSAGADFWRDAIADACMALDGIDTVFERSDADVREREGLPMRTGTVRGIEPPTRIEIHEGPSSYLVDVRAGHKTGFYLDQRESRRVLSRYVASQRVLNVFAYTGAFSVVAWAGGASTVTSVDSSSPALSIARENLRLNGYPDTQLITADAFAELRRRRDRGEQFDLVVLDPPKLVGSKQQVDRGARAYKDLNWLALRLLAPGGTLVTFSCSGGVTPDLFQKIVADAAINADREVQIVERLEQATDHPVLLSVPETQYLKGLVCRVL